MYSITKYEMYRAKQSLAIECLQRVTTEEIMRRTAAIPPATQVIRDAKLRYFGHVARSDSARSLLL